MPGYKTKEKKGKVKGQKQPARPRRGSDSKEKGGGGRLIHNRGDFTRGKEIKGKRKKKPKKRETWDTGTTGKHMGGFHERGSKRN